MAELPSPRAIVRRVLGRSQLETVEQMAHQQQVLLRSDRERIERLETRVLELGATLDGVTAALDRLHATVASADPELMRSVIEAVRDDVARLSSDLTSQVARLASS